MEVRDLFWNAPGKSRMNLRMSRGAGQTFMTVEHVLRYHMCQGGGYCSINTEMEVRDLVIFWGVSCPDYFSPSGKIVW